jgi:ABC-type multidrug transport system ATPase subunit
LGLGDALDKPARAFSRGMLQRLGLARALVGRPRVVLLDEPFTGLDRKATGLVLEVIDRLRREGAMVLMISHDLETTAALADEAYVLRRGQVAAHHDGALEVAGLHALWRSATEAP